METFILGFVVAAAICIAWYHFGLDEWFKRKVQELRDRL